jgi:hypothetical protein
MAYVLFKKIGHAGSVLLKANDGLALRVGKWAVRKRKPQSVLHDLKVEVTYNSQSAEDA